MFAVSDGEVLWVSIAKSASLLLPITNSLFVWDTPDPPTKTLPPDVIWSLSIPFDLKIVLSDLKIVLSFPILSFSSPCILNEKLSEKSNFQI